MQQQALYEPMGATECLEVAESTRVQDVFDSEPNADPSNIGSFASGCCQAKCNNYWYRIYTSWKCPSFWSYQHSLFCPTPPWSGSLCTSSRTAVMLSSSTALQWCFCSSKSHLFWKYFYRLTLAKRGTIVICTLLPRCNTWAGS